MLFQQDRLHQYNTLIAKHPPDEGLPDRQTGRGDSKLLPTSTELADTLGIFLRVLKNCVQ